MRLSGKTALITGAGAGIGRAAALLFAKEGAVVGVNSRSAGGQAVAEEILASGGCAAFFQGDVSREEDARRVVGGMLAAFERLDILVNNAGIVLPGRADNTEAEDWDRTMAVNARGVFLMSKYAVPAMKRTGAGVIVNIASVAALKGLKDRAAYSASKGAVVALTRQMAAEYMADGVRVNCVCPGTVDTPSLEGRIQAFADPAQARRDFESRQPLGRLGLPGEIAEAILLAASPAAGFMTGAVIVIDGGMTV